MTDLVTVLKALSSEPRLKIFRLLKERPLCVNAITRSMDISQPSVSQHLAVLRNAGLVTSHKRGYRVHYRLNADRLEQFHAAVAAFPGEGPRAA